MSLPFTTFSKDYLDEIKTSITKYITKTPVLSNKKINSICGAEIFFKCENFQKST
jgi:threonine dehydratase